MAKKTYKHTRVNITDELEQSESYFNDSLDKLGEVLGELDAAGDVSVEVDDLHEGVTRRKIANQLDEKANKVYELLQEAQDIIDDLRGHSGNLDEICDTLMEEGVKKKSKKTKKREVSLN